MSADSQLNSHDAVRTEDRLPASASETGIPGGAPKDLDLVFTTQRGKLAAAWVLEYLEAISASDSKPDSQTSYFFRRCRAELRREARRLEELLDKENGQPRLAEYQGEIIRLSGAGLAPYPKLCLRLVHLYDRTVILADSAWLQKRISMREHGRIIRRFESRLYRGIRLDAERLLAPKE